MAPAMPSHGNPSLLDFLGKRGESSAAFFLPFLGRDMALLDVGCGPGAITAVLAGKVRYAIGIDIEPRAIARASKQAADAGVGNLAFANADMTMLPFAEATFDAVFIHAVLYHLDPATLAGALGEARRVLRPGGVIGIRDSDVGGDILHPESAALSAALGLWMRWYGHKDKGAVRFGRRQGAVLRAHGFTPTWSGASYVNHSADAQTRRETVADVRQGLPAFGEALIARGLAEPREIDEALAAWDAWGSDQDAVYLRCRCECVAQKAS